MNATITWSENRDGIGQLTMRRDDGTTETVDYPEPINARTDSYAVASLFGRWTSVDHDRDTITVSN